MKSFFFIKDKKYRTRLTFSTAISKVSLILGLEGTEHEKEKDRKKKQKRKKYGK